MVRHTQECEWEHALADSEAANAVRSLERALAHDRTNVTLLGQLQACRQWRSSLMSLGDLVAQRRDAWRVLMDQVVWVCVCVCVCVCMYVCACMSVRARERVRACASVC